MRARGVDFLVIGGWAAIAHGIPRTTVDVDLFVRPEKENVERLVAALSEVGFGVAREIDPKAILGGHVFLFADQIRVDLFTRPWGLPDFDACWQRRRDIDWKGTTIPFVGLADLIRSKDTGREEDIADVEALRQIEKREKST